MAPATVSVIDGASNAIVRTVPTGGTGAVTLAVNKSLHKAYAANFQDKTVAVIDGASFATTSLPTGRSSYSLAINLATNRVYIAGNRRRHRYGDRRPDRYRRRHGANRKFACGRGELGDERDLPAEPGVERRYGYRRVDQHGCCRPVPAGKFPDFIAINEATNRIYVSNTQAASITVIAGGGGDPDARRRDRVLQRRSTTTSSPGCATRSPSWTPAHQGLARTGQSFSAYTTPQTGTSPVCRFYIPPAWAIRTSSAAARRSATPPDRRIRVHAGRSHFMYMFLPVAGVCPAARRRFIASSAIAPMRITAT